MTKWQTVCKQWGRSLKLQPGLVSELQQNQIRLTPKDTNKHTCAHTNKQTSTRDTLASIYLHRQTCYQGEVCCCCCFNLTPKKKKREKKEEKKRFCFTLSKMTEKHFKINICACTESRLQK